MFGKLRGKNKKPSYSEMSRLAEFGRIYMNTADEIMKIMEKKESSEIRQILETLDKINKKNCWFAIYRVKGFIKNAGMETIKKRIPKMDVENIPKEYQESPEMAVTEKDADKE